MGEARGGKRRIGTKCSGSGKRLIEDLERPLERGDGETEFAAAPAVHETAERAREFCAQRHGVGNEFPEIIVVFLGISGGAEFVEQSMEHVRGALSDRMDNVAIFIPHPINSFTQRIRRGHFH